jgi:hypothetical protein
VRFKTQLDHKEQKLAEKKALAQRVEKTLKSKGWQEIVGPLIDKTIKDIVGGKYGNKWSGGHVQKARAKMDYYVGYKQGLIDLHNRLWAYVNSIVILQKQIESIHKEREAKTQIPMLEE